MTSAPRRPARHWVAVAAGATALTMALAACGGQAKASGSTDGASAAGGKVGIVAFSVPKPAYDAAETAFQATPDGKGVEFSASYGPSGSQSKAVAAGQPADYVGFSVGPDLTRLVPDTVDAGWDSGSTKGIVSSSVVVLVVRKGNPKHITGWDDLVKDGVQIVTPSPATSGSAKWNILAAYEHVISDGGTPEQAEAYLTSFYKHIVSKPESGAAATTTFTAGTGDVLVSYENEAIASRQKGADVEYVVPNESVLIENPGAVTKTASPAAAKFLQFVESADGQKIFASKGFRPVGGVVEPGTVEGATDPANPFPPVAKLTTIASLGGWDVVDKKFFDKTDGIVTKIEASAG
ncbi:extracellular solute-binding protein [Cellulomonas alba]|uniref:Extracellular solute-binding protein n=1 Tax=Cellulomonas alba TaxID=3053467 RepID=A0ABT7SK32_9CELL|nr:extracellular solute-binding protein [Cellulomonas alba]MDM7855884.1 extracellular solute-binding protein [Cellulomonas alba]